MTTFSQNLKMLRKLKKLSQKDVAEAIGKKKPTYASYEEERSHPDFETLIELADLFEVTVDFLLTGKSGTLREEFSPWELEYNRATMHTRYNVNKLLGI